MLSGAEVLSIQKENTLEILKKEMHKISERHEQRLHDVCTAAASLLLQLPSASFVVNPMIDIPHHTFSMRVSNMNMREEEDVDGSDGTGNNIELELELKGEAEVVAEVEAEVEAEGGGEGEGDGETALTEIPIIPSADRSIRLPSYLLSERNRREDSPLELIEKVMYCTRCCLLSHCVSAWFLLSVCTEKYVVRMYVRMCLFLCIYVCVNVSVMYMCVGVCMYMCVCVCVYVCVCVCVCVCVPMYILISD